MSTEVSDCNTKHLVTYEIKDAKLLKKFNDKYYKIEDDEPLRLLDARKDKHLIGKKIKVRSAATCALGDCVCAKCIGRSASLNYDIAQGFSGFESEEVTRPTLVTLNLSNCGKLSLSLNY